MQKKDKIAEKCKKIFSKVMKVPLSKISGKTSSDTIETWDSLSHVQLVSSLEKNFKIKISPEEGIDGLNNFKQVVSFVQKKIKKFV